MLLPPHTSVMYILFGISTFIYGMTLASQSLQKLASNKIRDLLNQIEDKPYFGVLVGVIITILIQSSGAVTSMLVGLGSAGVISLYQVMSLLLGSAIGTTLTVQLLSFKVTQWGLPLFTFSFFVFFLTHKKTLKILMSAIMGFGLIFWGLEIIGMGTSELKTSSLFLQFLSIINSHPITTLVVTSFFTALFHSSAVTIGFAMTLAQSQLLTLEEAFYWVYGANIGTTASALIASIGSNYVGKQIAWAHTLYKCTSVGVLIWFTPYLASLIKSDHPARDIANIHTFFNILSAFLFYFYIRKGAQLIERLFPPSAHDRDFSVKFLNRRDYHNISICIAHAERELMRMGDICYSMIASSLRLFKEENPDLEEEINEKDNRVDLLNKEICLYLAEIMEEGNVSQQKQIMRLMTFATDLESIADVIDKNLMDLGKRKHFLKLEFNPAAWTDLEGIHGRVVEICSMSLTCFQRMDSELAAQVVALKRELRMIEKEARVHHLERLSKSENKTIKTSAVYLDTLGEYRHLAGLLTHHVYSLLKESEIHPSPLPLLNQPHEEKKPSQL